MDFSSFVLANLSKMELNFSESPFYIVLNWSLKETFYVNLEVSSEAAMSFTL